MYKHQDIADIGEDGEEVLIAGWVHKSVDLGKMVFVVLRDWSGSVQITAKKGVVDEDVLSTLRKVGREWVLQIKGKVQLNERAPGGKEVVPTSVVVLNEVREKLPVDPTGHVPSELDTRLTYRYLDLRKEDVRAIFMVKSAVVNAFRSSLCAERFVEIQPPIIIGAASEGGAEVFKVKYFESNAYLAQSPQLYKQLAVIGGLERVFSTMPMFRAEKHNTTTHLNEVTMLDAECAFFDHHDAMNLLEKLVVKMVDAARNSEGAALLGKDIEKVDRVPRHSYGECVEVLLKKNVEFTVGDDFSREHERLLAEEFGNAFFVYDYPTEVRAFYSYPYEDNPSRCKSFDLIYHGLEISSGAQRIHKYDVLIEQLKRRGLDPLDFSFYTEAFRMGAPPHSGFGLGLERMCMKMLDLPNVREAMLYPRDRFRLKP